jgi:hypothetical protein
VSLFVWALPFDLSDMGDPTSSYATAGIALRVTESHKPPHHCKVETPSGEPNPLNAELKPICHLLVLLGGATIVVVSRLRVNKTLFDKVIMCTALYDLGSWVLI